MKLWHYSVNGLKFQDLDFGATSDEIIENLTDGKSSTIEHYDGVGGYQIFRLDCGFFLAIIYIQNLEEIFILEDSPSLFEFMKTQTDLMRSIYEMMLARDALCGEFEDD